MIRALCSLCPEDTKHCVETHESRRILAVPRYWTSNYYVGGLDVRSYRVILTELSRSGSHLFYLR